MAGQENKTQTIAQRYAEIIEKIEQVVHQAGRDLGEVKLVVVTKTHPVEKILEVIDAGARFLGENYVEEAIPKKQAINRSEVHWHMIGHLQSRKAELAAQHCDYVHSLDSLKLAGRLNRFAQVYGRVIPVLLEINLSQEETKFGLPGWDSSHLPALYDLASQVLQMPNLELKGLMTIAPWGTDHESARPYFERLRLLKDQLNREFPQAALKELSMGMSADYLGAIKEGATWLRIGTAIMGERKPIE